MARPGCQDVQPGYVYSSTEMGAMGMGRAGGSQGVLVGHRAGAMGAYMVGGGWEDHRAALEEVTGWVLRHHSGYGSSHSIWHYY